MCFSAKNGKHITKGLPDYQGYKKGSEDDSKLVKELWHLLDRAEIVVAQNGDAFDLKKINARFAYHNLPPPSPYRTVDTLKVARRYFAFSSNKLDHLGASLGLGRKLEHEGFPLWKRCMAGDSKAWKKMKAYNKQDVLLLEKVYYRFLPWIKNHPNLDNYSDGTCCPKCGSKSLQKRGYLHTNTTKYARICCMSCGGWSRSPVNVNEKRPLINL